MQVYWLQVETSETRDPPTGGRKVSALGTAPHGDEYIFLSELDSPSHDLKGHEHNMLSNRSHKKRKFTEPSITFFLLSQTPQSKQDMSKNKKSYRSSGTFRRNRITVRFSFLSKLGQVRTKLLSSARPCCHKGVHVMTPQGRWSHMNTGCEAIVGLSMTQQVKVESPDV